MGRVERGDHVEPFDPRDRHGAVHVETVGVSKRFGGVKALDDVSLVITRGSIHGLVGENGAGKSTFSKILAGVLRPDSGEVWVNGRQVGYRSPRDALKDGITIIAQELVLEPTRSVLENVFLGLESRRLRFLVDRSRMRSRLDKLNEVTRFLVPPHRRVGNLRIADQQKVEILRALARESQLIIMDEPTASLSAEDAKSLWDRVRELRDAGATIVYISHNLDEVLSVADQVTILRDGRVVRTAATGEESAQSLVTAMLGRPASLIYPTKAPPSDQAPIVCSVFGLTRSGAFRNVSFDVLEGEIIGLFGLIGSGRSEIARAIFGADRVEEGEVVLNGRPFAPRSPADAIHSGVAMLPESRLEQGLILGRPVVENVTLPHLKLVNRGGVVDRRSERRRTANVLTRMDVRTAGLGAPVKTLSGGNQQRAMFAKWLFREPKLLIIDEPTRGVDVGAKHAIYELIASLAGQGLGIILISSEIDEVLGLAHRVLVVSQGRIVGEFRGDEMTEDRVLRAAFGTART